jgi:hypothetical protein
VEVSDKEISEIKINSVLKTQKACVKILKQLFASGSVIIGEYSPLINTRLYYIPPTFGIRLKYKLKIVIMALFVATKLQPYNSTALQLYNSTTLQPDSSTTLQLYNTTAQSTALQLYSPAPLQLHLYNATNLQPYNSAALEL